jgi:antitoxin component YwqK of YwqJK toxin-antitoxin module
MKNIMLITGLLVALCSCNAPSGSGAVQQHDTVVADKKKVEVSKDSVIQNGEYVLHYESGVIKIRGMMQNGKREGLWKSWYSNGSPWSETTFHEGIKNGPTTTWYENEKKRYEGFYTNDVESGVWKFWDEKGKLVSSQDYGKK